MKKIMRFLLIAFLPLWLGATPAFSADEAAANDGDSLQVEKLKLEIERLKLENQRLELQIKTLQMDTTQGGAVVSTGNPSENAISSILPTPTPIEKDPKKAAQDRVMKEMMEKTQVLAEQFKSDDHRIILDFLNGELWYQGVHYKIKDFRDLCEDLKWPVKGKFLKHDLDGDSLNRYQYKNIYFDRYDMQSRGVFVFETPAGPDDFHFVTPEMVDETSSFKDFRNRFQSAYFRFDHEEKKDQFRLLYFKHGADFLGFDDVLEFWFDSKDHLVRLRWGMLDKK